MVCKGETVGSVQRAFEFNRGGMRFSSGDMSAARALGVEGHLGVSNRSCVRAYRRYGRREAISGTCEPVEPPEEQSTL